MNQGGHKTGARLSAAMKSAPLYCAKDLRWRILYKSSVGDKKEILKCGPVDAKLAAFTDGGSFFRFLKSCAAFHDTDSNCQLIKDSQKATSIANNTTTQEYSFLCVT